MSLSCHSETDRQVAYVCGNSPFHGIHGWSSGLHSKNSDEGSGPLSGRVLTRHGRLRLSLQHCTTENRPAAISAWLGRCKQRSSRVSRRTPNGAGCNGRTPLMPALGGGGSGVGWRQKDLCELEASLVYIVSSRKKAKPKEERERAKRKKRDKK